MKWLQRALIICAPVIPNLDTKENHLTNVMQPLALENMDDDALPDEIQELGHRWLLEQLSPVAVHPLVDKIMGPGWVVTGHFMF